MHGDKINSLQVDHWQQAEVAPHESVSHTEYVISYHMAGSLTIDHGQIITTKPGTFTILPAGVPHRSLGGSNVEIWLVRFCAVCFELAESHPLMAVFGHVRRGALPVASLQPKKQNYLLGLLHAMEREQQDHSPETVFTLRALLLLVLAEVNRAMRCQVSVTEPQGSLVADALAFIQARCLTPISARDVAAAVGRTPAHVTATLKKHTGFSAGQWITSGRLSEAESRLIHTDDGLEEIAERVGWQDVTHFIRQFRKARGLTPAAWREKIRRS